MAADLTRLIDVLGSDSSIGKKREASRALVTAGKPAIAPLIRRLGDQRVYERRDIANRMNLPVTAKQPEPVIVAMTVGERCKELLYEIITPRGGSNVVARGKVFSTQPLRVDDWERWWAANKGKSLAQIHVDLGPLVDRYWQQHGTTQIVPDGQTGAAIPDVAEWDRSLPVPKGAVRNDSLGGATTLGPGRNRVVKVFDVASGIEVMTAFYERHLPGATREASGQGGDHTIRFKMSGGSVTLSPRADRGTRITLLIGPL
jgi:hypothetical protein